MKLFRRWTSVEDLELDSGEARAPLLNKAEKPLRSQKALNAAINDDNLKPRRNINTVNLEKISSLPKSARLQLRRQKTRPETPHHIFGTKHKRYMVYIVSFAGLFSPLSSNIYFPALGNVAKVFRVSDAQVALTITVYMILQGLAPSFWGSCADTLGRRPVFIGTFIIYLASNIGLALSPNLSTLMAFRAVQAIGSSATISIGAGVIADITTPAERGGLIGAFGGIRMLGQAIGPTFGGILTQFLGFRSIFWFLFILAAIALTTIIVLLPETLRRLAGNGSLCLHGWHKPLSYGIIGLPKPDVEPSSIVHEKVSWKKMIVTPIQMLCEKDVFVTLFFGSIVYAVWSMVTASTTALFQARYHLSDLVVGLAFLPNGLGCIMGSFITGKLLDHDFRVTEARYRRENNFPTSEKLDVKAVRGALRDFPIERARLRSAWWYVGIFCAASAVYGFSLSTHLAVPLILQFLIAYTATAVFCSNSTIMVDLYPDRSASATAVNNLARCSVGAVGVAVIEIILSKVGPRVTFGCLAALTVAMTPFLLMEWLWGRKWRMARELRGKEKQGSDDAGGR